jgi:EAL domain-containing protein (putative c-di-GMP-specific phosphodiesterase class I)
MHERMKRSRGLAGELSRALESDEFEVHYQPIVRLGDTRPTAVEALVRWMHPTRGLLMPIEFVPIAEAIGLMEQLGAWVLRQACADMAAYAPDLDLCVNVSDAQMIGPGLVATVLDTLVDTGFSADRLVLEVCERTVVPDLVLLGRALTALQTLGVRVALDDFGAGFSSLERLSRLPLDIMKIDACLVRNLADDENDRRIVHAIVSLAHSLDLSVVGEGVETVRQCEVLQEVGCVLGQGYLFGRPAPAASLPQWAARGDLIRLQTHHIDTNVVDDDIDSDYGQSASSGSHAGAGIPSRLNTDRITAVTI